MAVAASTLGYEWATTPPGAYFLHLDTANQDFAAIAWARGCWEYSTEKMIGVGLLTPLFRLFGPSTAWETVILALLGALSVAVVYELARLLSGSRLAGWLAAVLVTALLAEQYFSRTHVGYVLPFVLLAWLAVWHKRWAWAGLSFSLAMIGHFGYAVMIGISVLTLVAFHWRSSTWRDWLAFSLAGLAPVVVLELLFFAYMGRPFQWTRGALASGLTWSRVDNSLSASPDWPWPIRTVVGSNGWALAALLGLSLAAAFVRRSSRAGLALSLSSLAAVVPYWLVALRYESFISRPLAPLYPLWAIGFVVVASAVVEQIKPVRLRYVVAGLAAAAALTGVFIHEFTRTPFPEVEQTFRRAALAGRAVRYNNIWVSLYYAQVYGAEVLTGDGRWIDQGKPDQAVLIFEGRAPAELSRAGYTVESTSVGSPVDAAYPVLSREAILPEALRRGGPPARRTPSSRTDHCRRLRRSTQGPGVSRRRHTATGPCTFINWYGASSRAVLRTEPGDC